MFPHGDSKAHTLRPPLQCEDRLSIVPAHRRRWSVRSCVEVALPIVWPFFALNQKSAGTKQCLGTEPLTKESDHMVFRYHGRSFPLEDLLRDGRPVRCEFSSEVIANICWEALVTLKKSLDITDALLKPLDGAIVGLVPATASMLEFLSRRPIRERRCLRWLGRSHIAEGTLRRHLNV